MATNFRRYYDLNVGITFGKSRKCISTILRNYTSFAVTYFFLRRIVSSANPVRITIFHDKSDALIICTWHFLCDLCIYFLFGHLTCILSRGVCLLSPNTFYQMTPKWSVIDCYVSLRKKKG